VGSLRWSDTATWGGALPTTGQAVTVPGGTTIIWDVASTPNLGAVSIQSGGQIIADPTISVGMTCSDFMVMAGGTFTAVATSPSVTGYIECNGVRSIHTARPSSQGFTNDGLARAFNNHGTCVISYYTPAVVMTTLNAHALVGAASLTLAAAVGWPSGARIALAPTSFFDFIGTNETKIHTLNGATSGTTAALNETVAYNHWGLLQYPVDGPLGTPGMSLTQGTFSAYKADPTTPTVLDERAEVVLLSRNFEIRCPNDTAFSTQGWGVHFMSHFGSVTQITGACVRRGGQRGALGRYPFHTHMLSYQDTSATVTVSIANPCVINWTAHGMVAGQPLRIATTGALPTGLTASPASGGAVYYVSATGLTTNSFQPTTDKTGAGSIATTGTQSGVHTVTKTAYVADATTTWFRKCSMDQSENRLVSVHGTCGIEVSDCVGIDFKGMGYFFEDGSELRNTMTRCVAGKGRVPAVGDLLKSFDSYNTFDDAIGTSGFWLTHPTNTFTYNRAFDCVRNGIWNVFGEKSGVAGSYVGGLFDNSELIQLTVEARRANPTDHGNCVVHSNYNRGFETQFEVIDKFGNTGAPSGPYVGGFNGLDDPITGNWPLFHDHVSWKNNSGGYINNVQSPHYQSWTMFDNNGFCFEGSTHGGICTGHLLGGYSLNTADDGVVSSNMYQIDNGIRSGFASYHGLLRLTNTTFVNFPWVAGARTAGGKRDAGGGAVSLEDIYTFPAFLSTQDWTGIKLLNSAMGYFSKSPKDDGTPIVNDGDHAIVPTTLSAGAAISASSITLASVAEVIVNSPLGITMDNGNVHWAYATSKVGSVIGLSGNMPAAAALGNAVQTYPASFYGPYRNWMIAPVIYDPNHYWSSRDYFIQNHASLTTYAASLTAATSTGETAQGTTTGFSGVYPTAAGNFGEFEDWKAELCVPTTGVTVATWEIGTGYLARIFAGFRGAVINDGGRLKITHPNSEGPRTTTYQVALTNTDRVACDLILELPYSGTVVPAQIWVYRQETIVGAPTGSFAAMVTAGTARQLTAISTAGLTTREQKIAAVWSDSTNPLADKFWQDIVNNSIVVRRRGYNTDGTTRNITIPTGFYNYLSRYTAQEYYDHTINFWISAT
jgi:hypothetical protein